MKSPDFYLASADGFTLSTPRRCWRLKRMATGKRDDLLLIRIDPPLRSMADVGSHADGSLVILATRYVGSSLFPINKWPMDVHVAVPLVRDPERNDELQRDDLKSIGWGELYRTEADAQRRAV